MLTALDWTRRGGLAGRAVLIDYVAYAQRKGIKYSAMSRHPIRVSVIKEIANECNIEFHHGDLLLVRSGWIKWYEEHNPEERREKVTNGSQWVGVDGTEETLEFLWNNHFCAVAGDAIGWEVWPPAKPEHRKCA
jgi:hypothetical protein